MHSLNLLSPAEKLNVSKIRAFIILKNLTFTLTSLVIMCGIVLGFSYFLLVNHTESLDTQINAERAFQQEKNISSTEDAVKILNAYLTRAVTIQQQYVSWTNITSQLVAIVNEGIVLSSIDLSTVRQSCTIIGVARDRSALLTFQDRLGKVAFLKDINSPLSNFTQPENIAFTITAILNEAIHQ